MYRARRVPGELVQGAVRAFHEGAFEHFGCGRYAATEANVATLVGLFGDSRAADSPKRQAREMPKAGYKPTDLPVHFTICPRWKLALRLIYLAVAVEAALATGVCVASSASPRRRSVVTAVLATSSGVL